MSSTTASPPAVDDLAGAPGIREIVQNVDGGHELVRMFRRMGLWTADWHRTLIERTKFPSKFSDLSPDQLSDLNARTIAESGRILELIGAVNALEVKLKLRAKSARATARAQARKNIAADEDRTKAPTRQEVEDLAEDNPLVIDAEERLEMVMVVSAHLSAIKEANQLYKEAISREIAYRTALLNARVI